MKQLGPEITINPNFAEIRKQSSDNYFETCLMKHCDVTTFYLKEWKIKCEEQPSVWRKAGHSSGSLNVNQILLVTVEPNGPPAIMQNPPFVNTGTLYLPRQCRSAHHSPSRANVVPRCMAPQPQKLRGQQSPAFSHPTFPSPSTNKPPSGPHHPTSVALPLSIRWRLQKRTITGLTHITKDTSQLPQASSISQIWFPFVQLMVLLLSPAPRALPSTTNP